MNTNAQVVVVARVLLPAGLDPLKERFEVREGGLDSTRERVLELAPGASALVPDVRMAGRHQTLSFERPPRTSTEWPGGSFRTRANGVFSPGLHR